MDIRVFTAETTEQGYRFARERFGADAIVLRIEPDQDRRHYVFTVSPASESGGTGVQIANGKVHSAAAEMMKRSGFSGAILARLDDHMLQSEARHGGEAVAGCLDSLMRYGAFVDFAVNGRSLFFIGAPGAGKTVTIAKAANSLLGSGRRVGLVNFDGDRLGGSSQLEHLASIFDLPFVDVSTAQGFSPSDMEGMRGVDVLLCDTPGVHFWKLGEIDTLLSYTDRMQGKALLICPAGHDASETAEMLRTARKLNIRHLIVTKCDLTRRLGATLTSIIEEEFVVLGCQRTRTLAERITKPTGTTLADMLQSRVLVES